MKVSVCVITYNHGKFIKDALDSILMQKTDFDFEITIGDDYSTDNTREILLTYARRYPNKINLLLHPKKIGIMENFIQTFIKCQGKYIAMLEGDDFWISPYKLQLQANFLDKNPDYAITFHKVYIYDDKLKKKISVLPGNNYSRNTYYLRDILLGNFIPTCSVMLRNKLFGNFPRWFKELEMGDWPIHALNAQFGKIGYINKIMGVYRIHNANFYFHRQTTDRLLGCIKTHEVFAKHFPKKYEWLMKFRIFYLYLVILYLSLSNYQLKRVPYYLKRVLISLCSFFHSLFVYHLRYSH